MKVKLSENIMFEHIKEEGFLFNEKTEKIFEINGTGVFILKTIISGLQEKNEIINAITEEYEVEKKIAEEGFNNFIKNLKEFNLIIVQE
jgi:hypothetical protein